MSGDCMVTLAWWMAAALLGCGLVQLGHCLLFLRQLHIGAAAARPEGDMPRVSVLLPVRGLDQGFAGTLHTLLDQDYPNYEVQIVIDSPNDPAWPVARLAIETAGNVRVSATSLAHRYPTCSGKNSSLIQLLDMASPDSEVLAFVDSDAEIHRTWLRELVAPLRDPRVGLTFGNRWYIVNDRRWGTLVRYIWNACGAAPMHIFRTPWGGSMALRAELVRQTRIKELWSRVIVDDAVLRNVVLRAGRKIRFVPSVLVPDRAGMSLPQSVNYIGRQLAWTRLYAPTVWWPIVAFSIANLVAFAGCAVFAVVGLVNRDAATIAWAGGASVVYQFSLVAMFVSAELLARRVLTRNGRAPAVLTIGRLLRIVVGVPLVGVMHFLAMAVAMVQRTFRWRGITYRVRTPWDVRMTIDAENPLDSESVPALAISRTVS